MMQKAYGLGCFSEDAKARMREIIDQVQEWHAGDYPKLEIPAPAMFQLLETLDKAAGASRPGQPGWEEVMFAGFLLMRVLARSAGGQQGLTPYEEWLKVALSIR